MSKKSGCKSADNNMDGLNIYSFVQLGSGGMPAMITEDSVDIFSR